MFNRSKAFIMQNYFYDYSDIYFNKLHTLKLSHHCVREYETYVGKSLWKSPY